MPADSGHLQQDDIDARPASAYGSIPVDASASRAESAVQGNEFWRNQVTSRVQQHRAKRKGSDPDANMELRFPVQEAPVDARIMRARRFVALAATRSPFAEDAFASDFSSGAVLSTASMAEDVALEEARKVIHFPRSSDKRDGSRNAMTTVHDYHAAMIELEAEDPLLDSLRITEAGEDVRDHSERQLEPQTAEPSGWQEISSTFGHQNGSHPDVDYVPDDPPMVYRKEKAPPAEQLELPNFDDIQLEATHQPVLPDLESGPQPASLGQRMMAGAVDGAIVLAAAGLFNITFTQLAEENLHTRMALLCAVAVSCVLWTLYQYTFLVHGHGTPGMHMAQLELAKFDGKPVSAFDRRCRAVASALSGFSLGLGFLWALVDEDQLGWHDRMTKTLIRSSAAQPVMRETVW